MLKHLSVHPHPVCCGIYNVGHFGFSTTNAGAMGTRPLAELDADLATVERMVPAGMLMATINEEQIPHVEFLLEKHGYEKIVKDFGGNHGKLTCLYCKVLKKERSTKVGVLGFDGKDKRISNSVPGTTETKPAPKPAAPPVRAPINYSWVTATPARRTTTVGVPGTPTRRPIREW